MPAYTGSLTVADIKARVKRQFGDEVGSQITDADIVRWINDAMAEIAVRNDLLQKRATNATAAGESEIVIPPDLITVHTFRCDGNKLTELNTKEWDDYIGNQPNATGTPTHYSRWSTILNLYPKTDRAVTLTLLYTRQPTKVVNDTDVPELPFEYHNRIVDYCMAMAFELDDDTENSAVRMQAFATGVTETKNTNDWRGRDTFPMITVGLDDMGY